MSKEKRFEQSKYVHHLRDTKTDMHYYLTSEKIGCRDLFDEIERLTEENKQLKNELKKEKSLREYSDSMIDVDLIVNIRFSNGEWKADVSVIDDE